MQGDGLVTVKRTLEITAVCSATTEEKSRDYASLYAFVSAAIVMQNPSVGGLAIGTTWERTGTRLLASEEKRTLAAEGNVFEIEVADVMNLHAGLPEPPDDPYDVPEFPTIDETQVEVLKT